MSVKISIILPAKNESSGLAELLEEIRSSHPECEIIVVDDGSTDDTASISDQYADKVVSHPYSMGNGAAIKSGARAASGEILVFMDADGQHRPTDISTLLEKMESGYQMVIGARSSSSQASAQRLVANTVFNKIRLHRVHIMDRAARDDSPSRSNRHRRQQMVIIPESKQ